MQVRLLFYGVFMTLVAMGSLSVAQQLTDNAKQAPRLVQGTLIAPGSRPFHLKAYISEGRDAPDSFIEMYWQAPDRWRRIVQSSQFEQTLVVNGDKVFEQDSPMYMPPELDTLLTAMLNPQSILDALQPGDQVRTKANGASFESGVTCFDPAHRMCLRSSFGLIESVGASAHAVDFTNYRDFHGKRIARRLIHTISVGDYYTAEITTLEDLKNADAGLFAVSTPTPAADRLHVATLSEAALRGLALNVPEIIWPQVLDGAVTGKASFFLSIDREGTVRDVLPLKTANERSNDSAIRQLLRWKFTPAIENGMPAQAEGVLTFNLNTRAWGPSEPLTDAEARKQATSVVEPIVSPGMVPPNSVFKLWIAVDSDGIIIEEIEAGGPNELFEPCDAALKQWHFKPIMENGQPRPFRALIEFHIP